MKVAQLTPDLSVAPQLDARDLEEAAARGFRSVINNRPDGEAGDQPAGAELQAAAERLGLDYRHVPVVSGQISDGEVRAFAAALADMPKPVIAFCRSGTRSTTLWALASAQHLDPDAILGTAKQAGYDLAGLRPLVEFYAAKRDRSQA